MPSLRFEDSSLCVFGLLEERIVVFGTFILFFKIKSANYTADATELIIFFSLLTTWQFEVKVIQFIRDWQTVTFRKICWVHWDNPGLSYVISVLSVAASSQQVKFSVATTMFSKCSSLRTSSSERANAAVMVIVEKQPGVPPHVREEKCG